MGGEVDRQTALTKQGICARLSVEELADAFDRVRYRQNFARERILSGAKTVINIGRAFKLTGTQTVFAASSIRRIRVVIMRR